MILRSRSLHWRKDLKITFAKKENKIAFLLKLVFSVQLTYIIILAILFVYLS
ncbi:MAG: hypothetical protein ACI815_001702 [Psychroserpens sp.]|jgi:hypothetical protein